MPEPEQNQKLLRFSYQTLLTQPRKTSLPVETIVTGLETCCVFFLLNRHYHQILPRKYRGHFRVNPYIKRVQEQEHIFGRDSRVAHLQANFKANIIIANSSSGRKPKLFAYQWQAFGVTVVSLPLELKLVSKHLPAFLNFSFSCLRLSIISLHDFLKWDDEENFSYNNY